MKTIRRIRISTVKERLIWVKNSRISSAMREEMCDGDMIDPETAIALRTTGNRRSLRLRSAEGPNGLSVCLSCVATQHDCKEIHMQKPDP